MRQVKYESHSSDGSHRFLSESFDRRTLLDMEAALDRASRELPHGQRHHDIRTFIASRIIESVVCGAYTEDDMTRAALGAVKELAGDRRVQA
jgi:hypothetical protein